jgi:hypothetical protein
MDSPRLKELREQHAAAQTERERAGIESNVLTEIRRLHNGLLPDSPRTLIARVLEVSPYVIEHRRALLMVGDLADPLWELLDADLTLRAATDLVRRAKHVRVPPETTASALRRAIAEYYALPITRALPNGKLTRHASTAEQRIGRPPGRRSTPKPEAPKAQPRRAPEPRAIPSVSADDFWKHLRGMCAEYARSRLPDHSDEQIDADLRILETDLKVVFEQFTDRVRNKLRDTPLTVVVARRQLTESCRVLLLDPPRDMQKPPPAFFEKAKRQFKVLAREYHPDTSTGGEATRPQFESVMNAWNVLQQFQRQLQATHTSNSKGDSP